MCGVTRGIELQHGTSRRFILGGLAYDFPEGINLLPKPTAFISVDAVASAKKIKGVLKRLQGKKQAVELKELLQLRDYIGKLPYT